VVRDPADGSKRSLQRGANFLRGRIERPWGGGRRGRASKCRCHEGKTDQRNRESTKLRRWIQVGSGAPNAGQVMSDGQGPQNPFEPTSSMTVSVVLDNGTTLKAEVP
jgi:hypothetical protein